MIYILTGAIRSGKTTALKHWVKQRTDVDGLLCPDGKHGKRYFLNIASQEEYPLENANVLHKNSISVGSFQFMKSAFQKANKYVINSAENQHYNYLIIDELGKLELRNEGLHDAAIRIISEYERLTKQHLILVVRESLLHKIIQHYHISDYSILKKEDLKRFP